ncbi:MAG TPA: hypothetical protein VHA77_05765 [Xanthobacteraceae bacterium]|nr:hypothetical protein [Xanthobacteraceae bacterium]
MTAIFRARLSNFKRRLVWCASWNLERRHRVVLLFRYSFMGASQAGAQAQGEAYATQYFLDQPPSASALSSVPADAREVVVAKVHVRSIFSLIGRDRSGQPPILPKYSLGAEVRIADVLSGRAPKGGRLNVSFGPSGPGGERYLYPHTPRMRAQDYFVVSYLDEQGIRCVLGFPVGYEDYERWSSEVYEYERIRGRPGVRQD